MSFKKNLAKSAVGFLFATFLTFAVLFFSLAQITDKETMKPIAIDIAEQQITPDELNQLHAYILQQCGNEKSIQLPFQNEQILIDCEKARSSTPEMLIEVIYSKNLDTAYNVQYDCEFLECLRTQPTVIFSKKANDFFLNATYLSIILTAIFGILLVLLSSSSKGKFINKN